MRNFPIRFLGAVALIISATSSVSAQSNSFFKPTGRPGAGASAVSPTEPVAEIRPADTGRSGAVSPNTPLVPGAEVSFKIVEENEAPVRAIVADTGELEIPGGMGRVNVNGMTSSQASAAVKSYLEGLYYKRGKATVVIGLNVLPMSGQTKSKVIISGKVARAGAVEFYSNAPKTLSEAVIEAGVTSWSDLKNVKVTRGTQTLEYNVKDILENGNTKNDFPLRDGDRISVPALKWNF